MNEDMLKAINIVQSKMANKIEGPGWMVYRVGNIVRIDIKDTK